jgi:carbamoyltransferase
MTAHNQILGISAFYHDSAAALIRNGTILAAAQEERFTRKKFDPAFPSRAIAWCLSEGNTSISEIDHVVFYDKPWLKFERIFETFLAVAPKGLRGFIASMPVWLKEKANLRGVINRELSDLSNGDRLPAVLFTEHHQAHAASAFFPSPFNSAAVLCMDGVGEWATTSLWQGDEGNLKPVWELQFPHSLGLLYSAFTYFTGFKVNSGEYKVMGLAPYGEPRYVQVILDNLIDLKEDGTFRLNLDYFNFLTGVTMTNGRFANLFGGPARRAESPLTQREMDLAASVQKVTEEVVLRLARKARRELATDYLCLAGGVALNCVANGRVLREGGFRDLWVQPAAGDAGGALGAALAAWHCFFGKPRTPEPEDSMRGSLLGPAFGVHEVKAALDAAGARYVQLQEHQLVGRTARLLADGAVIGWFQGRMEFGPRALGSRSILGDARCPEMQTRMNLKIKHRESFRPFAPAVRVENATDYFEIDRSSPYMLFVAPVRSELRRPITEEQAELHGIEKLKVLRSVIPAVTHIDFSARIQTVDRERHPRFHRLLECFEALTGSAVLINTSFNMRGEPIVCTPADAYRCFMRTEMDYLVLEDFLLAKSDQPSGAKEDLWDADLELD